ncbi:MAG: RnfABCDGE type electron transport complex subunit B [Candidatus Omnitrophica bacterium]|nr:RnfABCDGE type electron transport complex subunit B [Candidatus Omnitrophota bacterium]MCM8806963.1 RnfABCDGE type electron transport complex subunit B [Candidatus Omnitrophota bacterium]
MIISIIVVGCLGLFFGIFLTIIYSKFKTEENPFFSKIYSLLPKANCGGCGFAGCNDFAENLIDGKTTPERCVMLNEESIIEVCNLLGIKNERRERNIARICCYGGDNAKKKFEYTSFRTCSAVNAIFETNLECPYGCIGFGDCIRICPVNAISLNEKNIPEINEEICIGCGKCIEICPKKIIKLIPSNKKVYVACSSKDKGAVVVKICQSGCIGCGKCSKSCPQNAIKIEDNLAIIDYEKCNNCGKCVEECPRKIIFISKISILA